MGSVCCSHFTDKTEAQKGKDLGQGHSSCNGQSWDLNIILLDPTICALNLVPFIAPSTEGADLSG